MKKIITLLTLLMIMFTGHTQVNSSCSIAKELRDAYDDDIYWLAFNRINETSSPYRDSIKIPIEVEDTIWTGLAAIFNADYIPERDSIFDIYCIHHEICSNQLSTITVFVDTSYSWTEHWKNHETITGYDELDKFLYDYNYEIQYYYEGMGYLISDDHINVIPFIDSLKKFDGIADAFYGDATCCHNDIYYENTYLHQYFTFDLGYSHGIILCPNHHSWKFDVYGDCSVKLLESKFSILDPQVSSKVKIKNCQISSGLRNTTINKDFPFLVHPNPADDVIYVTSEITNNYSITIFNILGTIVYNNVFTDAIEVSLNDHKPGLYIIYIHDDNKISNSFKIIKK